MLTGPQMLRFTDIYEGIDKWLAEIAKLEALYELEIVPRSPLRCH